MTHIKSISVCSVPSETRSTLGNQYLLSTYPFFAVPANSGWCVREKRDVEEGAKLSSPLPDDDCSKLAGHDE